MLYVFVLVLGLNELSLFQVEVVMVDLAVSVIPVQRNEQTKSGGTGLWVGPRAKGQAGPATGSSSLSCTLGSLECFALSGEN